MHVKYGMVIPNRWQSHMELWAASSPRQLFFSSSNIDNRRSVDVNCSEQKELIVQ